MYKTLFGQPRKCAEGSGILRLYYILLLLYSRADKESPTHSFSRLFQNNNNSGNDSAAGHGNFFGEQYTMVLQDRARDLFHSVGLDFVARPYAKGGATSAPELAACAQEIFGTDVDMITWDFALTDGRVYWRIEFFAHRVMMLKNHPTMLVLNSGTEPARQKIVDHLTEQGMAALRHDGRYVIDRMLKAPDSKGKSDDEIGLLPEPLQYMRCGWGIETGFPCHDHKFTQNGTCDTRPHRTNWHKGW